MLTAAIPGSLPAAVHPYPQTGTAEFEMSVATLSALPAVTATIATATAETTTATSARTVFLWTSLTDRQLTAAEFSSINLLSRDLGLFIRAHGDKGEAAWAARCLVRCNINVGNGAELAEMRTELVFSGLEREVSNV